MNIGDNISRAIKENKWLNVSYINNDNINTFFWIAVFDIEFETKKLYVSIFNIDKSDTRNAWIKFEKIIYAEVIELTTYERPDELIKKIEQNIEKCEWLNYDHFNNNILNYYMECSYLDIDPVQKEYECVPGIDLNLLMSNSEFPLNDKQMKKIIADIYHFEIKNVSNSHYTLIINKLSIDKGRKKYIVCYYELTFDPKRKSLIIIPQIRFNTSFMIEGRPQSILMYIQMDVDEFTRTFEENQQEYENIISGKLWYGEYINTKPEIMILEREINVDLAETFLTIEEKYKNKTLPIPLKSFFGSNSKRNYMNRPEPSLVIYDEKINIDQALVLYNSLKYPVTYVRGPPGTGKTQTILNIIMSGFYNNKSMLICSSNNKPVDGIIEKLELKYHEETIPFPYIRLGNYKEMLKATKKIKEYYEMIDIDISMSEDDLISMKLFDDENHEKLIELLKIKEEKTNIQNIIKSSKKLVQSFGNETSTTINKIKEKSDFYKERLNQLPDIKNKDLSETFVPFKVNEFSSSYFYYKSYQHINKLKNTEYGSLIKICSIQEENSRVKKFIEWCSVDNNMKLLTQVFPIIFSTNISTRRLGTPRFMFDIVVMDEAGQCNIATSLIPITKANSLVLIGDLQQLRPVIVLEDLINEILMNKYNVPKSYNYRSNSILDVMLSHDKISNNILLSFHYRCGRKIIKFSNQRFYNNELNLTHLKNNGELDLLKVENNNVKYKNEAYDEAVAIVNYIIENKINNVSIITPFVNQKELISKLLKTKSKLLKEKNINDIHCGTIHSLQGSEKDVIIFSLAISKKTRKRTYEWINKNYELINVAVTRAKKKLIIAADTDVINILSKPEDDLYNLIKYVQNNGNIVVPSNESIQVEIGRSNGSRAEDEFYATISQFCSCHRNFSAKRNISLSKLFNRPFKPDLEFDLILFSLIGEQRKPSIAFEINGGEHLDNPSRIRSDKLKCKICEQNNIKLIFIDNSFVKNYENIIQIILSIPHTNN